MSGAASSSSRFSSERGSALIVTILVSTLALTLGLCLMLLGETEQRQSKSFLERQRAQVAARDAVEVAAAWFTAPPDRVPSMPPAEEWITDLRRGDRDGDGRADATCDGSRDGGGWSLWPVSLPDQPAAARLSDAVHAACGTATHPDLLLTVGGSPFLTDMAATLGDDVVIERVSVHAAPALRVDGLRATALEVSATVALRRGALLVARVTATARVRMLPSLASGDVIAAGGDVTIEPGAEIRWGRVACDADIFLPSLDDDAFPHSGLPRQADGSPVNFAPGGPVDWSLATPPRECVLTELMGRTKRGAWVLSQDMVAPRLPDPWLSFAAGGVLHVGGEPLGDAATRQPRPYDARWTDLESDLSHLSVAWALRQSAGAPGRAKGVEELALAMATPGSGVRRFVLAGDAGPGAEPRWREAGIGPARTAGEWLASVSAEAPLVAAFVTGGAPPPASVTISGGRGVVLVEARRVTIGAASGSKALRAVTMPGEPFIDTGIDADGDGEIDPGTAGNGRWDADIDDDGLPDEGEPQAWLFESQVLPWTEIPSRDADPATLESMPHEPFLNLDYPAEDAPDPGVIVRSDAGLAGTGRPVRDLDGDGTIRNGLDRLTGVARDEEGARQSRRVGFAGIVACLGGDIVATEGSSVHGALRATGSVRIETGAAITFDAALERDGVPSDQGIPSGTLGDIACVAGILVDPLAPAASPLGDDQGPARKDRPRPGKGGGAGGAPPQEAPPGSEGSPIKGPPMRSSG